MKKPRRLQAGPRGKGAREDKVLTRSQNRRSSRRSFTAALICCSATYVPLRRMKKPRRSGGVRSCDGGATFWDRVADRFQCYRFGSRPL
jgi:hypothetical protein